MHAQNDEERELSAQMQTALEAAVRLHTFPKANVDIYCLVLESAGSDLAVCICAASLALADAGIEMEDMVSACSVVSVHTTCPRIVHPRQMIEVLPTVWPRTQIVNAGDIVVNTHYVWELFLQYIFYQPDRCAVFTHHIFMERSEVELCIAESSGWAPPLRPHNG
jgi:hypothetical protein